MALLANVALTNTFDTWRLRTNALLTRVNAYTINESSLYANTLTANVRFVSSGSTRLGTTGSNRTIVNGLLSANGNLNVAGNTTIGGILNVNGGINLGDATTDLLTITGRASIGTNLTVSGNTSLGGWATISTANAVFDGSTTNPLVRITQRGTGDVLRIEDSTTTDTTPLVIKADGTFVKGTSNAYSFYLITNQYTPGFQTHAISTALASWGQFGWSGVTPIHAFCVSNTAVNSYGAVVPGENIGILSFNAANNSAFTEGAKISAVVPTNATNLTGQYIPMDLRFATSPGGSTVSQNRLFIYSNGHSYFPQTLAVNQNFTVNGNTFFGNSNTADRTTISGLVTVKGRQLVTANLRIQGNTELNGTTTDKSNALSQTLTDGATITWDTSLGRVATVTLGGNRTISAATNQKVGTYILRVVQDGSGGRTLTWNGNYKWTAQTAPVLSTAAGAVDIITFFSDGSKMYGSYLPDMR